MTEAVETRRRNHAVWIGPVVVFAGAVSYFTVFAHWRYVPTHRC